MMEDTLILLRFNCPDGSCDYIASGWGDLKLHVRGAHGNLMWYEPSPFLEFGCGPNYVQTATFAFGRRKSFLTNMRHILRTLCRTTYRLFNCVDIYKNRKGLTLMLIRCVSFVGSVHLVTTNCTRTCGRNMKSVSSANEMGLCINSECASYDT